MKYVRTKKGYIAKGNYEIGEILLYLDGEEKITKENIADTLEELIMIGDLVVWYNSSSKRDEYFYIHNEDELFAAKHYPIKQVFLSIDDGTLADIKPSPLEALEKILNKFVEILLENKHEKATAVTITYLTNSLRVAFHNELDIIEKELKEAEKFKSIRFITVDELVSDHPLNIDQRFFVNKSPAPLTAESFHSAEEDENKIKALEIIKESLLIEENDFYYDEELDKYFFIGKVVSKEKYDLLKEVLL